MYCLRSANATCLATDRTKAAAEPSDETRKLIRRYQIDNLGRSVRKQSAQPSGHDRSARCRHATSICAQLRDRWEKPVLPDGHAECLTQDIRIDVRQLALVHRYPSIGFAIAEPRCRIGEGGLTDHGGDPIRRSATRGGIEHRKRAFRRLALGAHEDYIPAARPTVIGYQRGERWIEPRRLPRDCGILRRGQIGCHLRVFRREAGKR